MFQNFCKYIVEEFFEKYKILLFTVVNVSDKNRISKIGSLYHDVTLYISVLQLKIDDKNDILMLVCIK